MAETIRRVTLRRLGMPLHVPYKLSYRTFEEFEPYLVEIVTTEGGHGFGDGHISPGSSDETREGGWAFSREMAGALLGNRPRLDHDRVAGHTTACEIFEEFTHAS